MNILIIEDDFAIASIIRLGMKGAGYGVTLAADGRAGLRMALEARYDLVILDVNLPGMNGWAVCRAVRELRDTTPILMLTARDAPEDRILGLEMGADDYLTKPFHFPELLMRVRNLIRRKQVQDRPLVRIGDLEIDIAGRTVARGGRAVELSRREFSLLEVLAFNEGRVLTRYSLNAWRSPEERGTVETLQEDVAELRRKINGAGEAMIFEEEGGCVLRAPARTLSPAG